MPSTKAPPAAQSVLPPEPVVKAEGPSVPSSAVASDATPEAGDIRCKVCSRVLRLLRTRFLHVTSVRFLHLRRNSPLTPPETPKPVAKGGPRFYTVQVGAFGSSDNAETLVVELKKKFEGVFVDKAPSGATPYRVRVGRLVDLAAARQIQSRLTAQGFDSSLCSVILPVKGRCPKPEINNSRLISSLQTSR